MTTSWSERQERGNTIVVVLKKAALLVVALFMAGCASSEKTGRATVPPEQAKRYLVYEKLTGEKGIWIADVDGHHPRRLVPEGHSPMLSPDGRWVAYLGNCGREDACRSTAVISTSGGNPRLFSLVGAPAWSPDSARIVGVRGPSPDNEQLVTFGVANGRKSTLARGSFYGWSFSPDATRIVYSGRTNASNGFAEGSFDLFVVEVDGGEPKQITHAGDSGSPVWSPTDVIAFTKFVPDRGWGRNEIWQIRPDGSDRRTITGPLHASLRGQGFTGLIPVGWSDDGHVLLGGWTNEWGSVPVAVDPARGKARKLVTGLTWEAVAISHDGRSALAYTSVPVGEPDAENAIVATLPLAGGKPTILAHGAGSPSWNR